MKNTKTKIFSIILAICLIVPALAFFTGCSCGEEEESTTIVRLHTSLNITSPISCTKNSENQNAELLAIGTSNVDIDLVVDNNNCVVATTSLSKKADEVLASIEIENAEIGEAVDLVMKSAMKSGLIAPTGTSFQVEINGTSANKVNNIESKINESISTIESKFGIELSKTMTKLEVNSQTAKEELISQLSYLAPEMTEAEIRELSEKDIINKIKAKAIELKNVTFESFQKIITYCESSLARAKEIIEQLGSQVPPEVRANFEKGLAEFNAKKGEMLEEFKQGFAEATEKLKEHQAQFVVENKSGVRDYLQNLVNENKMSQEAMNAWLELFNAE